MIRFNNQFVRVSFRSEDFRVAVAKPLVALFGTAFLLTETLLIWPEDYTATELALFSSAGMLVICAALLLLVSSCYHLQVGPDGVDVHGFWPRRRHLNWRDVTGTRLCRFFGLEYLILQLPQARRSIWIPLLVQRSELFLEMVLTYAEDRIELKEGLKDVA